MKAQQQQAWVLHTRPYRESSLLVELFTRRHGRVSVVAKGVKGRKNVTPPRQFLQCLVSWVGRGPLFSLTECELSPGVGLQGDALACGFYVNELLLRMVEPFDVHDYLFETYSSTVAALAGGGSMSAALRRFEYALLQDCGYLPDFTSTGDSGAAIEPGRRYALRANIGFVEIDGQQGAATEAPEAQEAVDGAVLTAIFVGEFHSGRVRRAARQIFQAALKPHLGDRPLASRELLSGLPRKTKAAAETPGPDTGTESSSGASTL